VVWIKRLSFTVVLVAGAASCYAQPGKGAPNADGAVPPPPPGRSSAPVSAMSAADLVAALRKGGLAIYFRHTATDFSRNDAKSRGPEDCDNQRPLTDRGREDARAVGAAIRQLGIPIGTVLASPTCRTAETGKLIFGRAEPSRDVRGGPASLGAERYAPLVRLLSTPQPAGTNLAISSHGNPFFGVAGPPYLAEGEMAVVRGKGSDFEVVARVRVDEWAGLLAYAGKR
jgi:hypothetical protein